MPADKPKRKHPTLAECKVVAGTGGARAIVLQKLCHYYSAARFDIDGIKYTAPKTQMLVDELGLSRSTIQKAIKDLEDRYVIETVSRHFNRSPRRYVRVLIDPVVAENFNPHSEPRPRSDSASSPNETMTVSDSQTVHTKKEKKKKIEKKTQLFQGRQRSRYLLNIQQHSAGTTSTNPFRQGSDNGGRREHDNSTADAIDDKLRTAPTLTAPTHLSRSRVSGAPLSLSTRPKSDAVESRARQIGDHLSSVLSDRRGWTKLQRAHWGHLLMQRLIREHLRGASK